MKTTISPGSPRFILLAILLVFLAGCGGTGGGGPGLSEVMTRKDAEEQEDAERRRGEGRTRTRAEPVEEKETSQASQSQYVDSDDTVSDLQYEDVQNTASVLSFLFNLFFSGNDENEGGGAAQVQKADGREESGSKIWAGYRYSRSRLGGDAITGFDTSTLMLGLRGKNGNLGYAGFYFGNGTTGRADLDETITNLDQMGLELGLMIYLTPSRSRMGGYIETGFRFGEIGWDYRDSAVGSGGDFLGEFGPFLGLGVAILQTKHVHLGASVFGGIWFVGNESDQGFQNDVFKDVGYYQVNFKGIIHF